jgi:hypothetical protein
MRRFHWCLVLPLSLALSACQPGNNAHQEEIERLSRLMERHFEDQQWGELCAYFQDTAIIAAPGGYRIQGREMHLAYWRRYFLPLGFRSLTRGVSAKPEELQRLDEWPSTFQPLPGHLPEGPGAETQSLYHWADWTLRFEGEDGVIRQEAFPVLLIWKRQPEHGWQIVYLFQG